MVSLRDVQAVLTFAGVMLRLLESGTVTVWRLREIAATAGATPEELANLDQRLSDAIARREAESST